jgi:hypothetical protein
VAIYINNRRVHHHIIRLRTKVYRLSLGSWQVAGISNPIQVPRRKRQAIEGKLHLENQSNILERVFSREETNLEQKTTAIESN